MMNAREAFGVMYPDEAVRIRRRELESEAEAERMAIKAFEAEASTWLQKAHRARLRLQAHLDELKELGATLP